jgi:hypothetical protein
VDVARLHGFAATVTVLFADIEGSTLALSSIARYHPEEWSVPLARDKSQAAVPIEEALDIDRELLPWLLWPASAAVANP